MLAGSYSRSITGWWKVASITSDFRDQPQITIGSGKRFESHTIMCSPATGADYASLNKGDAITITGRVKGEIMGNIRIEKCTW